MGRGMKNLGGKNEYLMSGEDREGAEKGRLEYI